MSSYKHLKVLRCDILPNIGVFSRIIHRYKIGWTHKSSLSQDRNANYNSSCLLNTYRVLGFTQLPLVFVSVPHKEVTVFILLTRKLMLRELEWFDQGHSNIRRQNWVSDFAMTFMRSLLEEPELSVLFNFLPTVL